MVPVTEQVLVLVGAVPIVGSSAGGLASRASAVDEAVLVAFAVGI